MPLKVAVTETMLRGTFILPRISLDYRFVFNPKLALIHPDGAP